MPAFAYRLVTIDLDGTLTRVHGWRLLAQAFGRASEYEATHRRFFAREISEDAHLKNLLDTAVGRSVDEVERVLDSTPLVEGIGETLRELRSHGARVALLTHNPTYVCDWYLRRFGFDAAEGTEGTVIEGERIVESGPARADKRSGLLRLRGRWGVRASQVAHVGDGWADAALFPLVGAGIAFNSLLPEVEARADASLHSESLRAIVPVLERVMPRRVVEAAEPVGQDSNTLNRV